MPGGHTIDSSCCFVEQDHTLLLTFYNGFIADIWKKLNRKRLADFMSKVASQIEGEWAAPHARSVHWPQQLDVAELCTALTADKASSVEFLKTSCKMLEAERWPDSEAILVLQCDIAIILLDLDQIKVSRCD